MASCPNLEAICFKSPKFPTTLWAEREVQYTPEVGMSLLRGSMTVDNFHDHHCHHNASIIRHESDRGSRRRRIVGLSGMIETCL